jgi:hypothetical protein
LTAAQQQRVAGYLAEAEQLRRLGQHMGRLYDRLMREEPVVRAAVQRRL